MTRRGRQGLALAGGLSVLGLLLVAVAGRARWVTAVPADPQLPGGGRVPLPGSTLVPAELPLALMAVAGVAVAATSGRMARGALRMAAALLTALAGVAVSVLAIRVGVSPAPAVRTVEAARQALATAATDRSAAPVLTAIGGTALAAAGLVALLVRRSWPGLAARYERDPERTVARPAAPASTWEALDRGDDPTADAGTGAADAPRKSVEHSD